MKRYISTVCAAVLLAVSLAAMADGPKVLKKVPPDFPPEAARKGITEGVLKASLSIDAGGAVTGVNIVEATPSKAKIFSDAATEALKQWKFAGTGKAETFELKLVFQQD
jgi:TonB family protein